MTATAITHPLDTLRLRLALPNTGYQGSESSVGRARFTAPTGMMHALRVIVAAEGPWALYRGLGPALVGVAPYAALNFSAYDLLKLWLYDGGRYALAKLLTLSILCCPRTVLHRPQGVVSNLLVGAAAGTWAATVCYPLDTVRRRMQVRDAVYRSQLDALVTIWRAEGWRGYYRCGEWLHLLHAAAGT